jgi:hypothetical protein
MIRVKAHSSSASRKSRKKTFPKQVSRADFVSRDTVQNHKSGTCVCEHKAVAHYSSAFQDCLVKRCNVKNCNCKDFEQAPFFNRSKSKRSQQDQRSIAYQRKYEYSRNCSASAYKYSDKARATSVRV